VTAPRHDRHEGSCPGGATVWLTGLPSAGKSTIANGVRTGVARARGEGRFEAVGDAPAAESPHAGRGLRYLAVADVAGVRRLCWEATRADGAHELRTEVLVEAGLPDAA
jgi:hypothetical protein